MLRLAIRPAVLVLLVLAAGCGNSSSSGSFTFTGIPTGNVPLGSGIAWTPVDVGAGELVRTVVTDSQGQPVWVSGFDAPHAFEWQPPATGVYTFVQQVRSSAGDITTSESELIIDSRALDSGVLPTSHPLVAGFFATVAPGEQLSVEYHCTTCSGAAPIATPPREGQGEQEFILLAGLRPNSAYEIQPLVTRDGRSFSRGASITFNTGPLPIEQLPINVIQAPPGNLANTFLAIAAIPSAHPSSFPWIVDGEGEPVWYYDRRNFITRPTGEGWATLDGLNAVAAIDYLGNSVRRLTTQAANLQLEDLVLPPITGVHHEFRPLPGGRWVTLAYDERFITDLQGPGEVNVVGDAILVLDDEMQIVWYWNSFDHLDVTRLAVGGDVCNTGEPGCPVLTLASQANDWTHSNAVDYDPADGNLIMSIRHQNWVVKVAYEDGAGDGSVVWRLGEGGDFTINSADPYPWFSYQHDSNVLIDGTVAVYDNGNSRISDLGGNSRGQVFALDEINMVAEPVLNADLAVASLALGSAALTPDGDYHFNSGFLQDGGLSGFHDDVAPDGSLVASFQTVGALVYRSFRMSDPYDTSSN